MPYSKTPAISTYETKRVNFFQNSTARSYQTDKDFRLVNMMIEEVPNSTGQNPDIRLRSRACVVDFTYPGPPTGTPRGIFVVETAPTPVPPAVYTVVGNVLYNGFNAVQTLSTSTGAVGWAEFLSSTGQKSLILVDGTDGYVIITNFATGLTTSVTKIVDPDFPTPHVPKPVVLDAYLFLAKADTNDIYNSNLDHPELWTAGDFISAEMYADNVIALAKNNNYLYALGTDSVEFFYDNANPTGTPLARQASAVQQMGCACANSVVQTEKQVVFVGTTSNGGYTVWLIDSFSPKEISIPAVREALFREAYINHGLSSTVYAYVIRSNNQKLYVLRLTDRTFVYSFDTDMWHEWSSGYGTTGLNAERNFDGVFAAGGFSGAPYLQIYNGTIQLMYDDAVQSYSTTLSPQEGFQCTIQTQRLNFDTINRKTMSRLSIYGDNEYTGDTPLEVSVQWSDDDYKTWSTPRSLYLDFYGDFPLIHQLGTFRQRAFKFICRHASSPVRIQGMEVDINKGIR